MIRTLDLGAGRALELWPPMANRCHGTASGSDGSGALGYVVAGLDGARVVGSRPVTPDNVDEARAQGYDGTDASAVWRSLVEHEALHLLAAPLYFGVPSYVMRHEAGIERVRYALRLHEEAVCLSLQRYFNTGRRDPVLGTAAGAVTIAHLADAPTWQTCRASAREGT